MSSGTHNFIPITGPLAPPSWTPATSERLDRSATLRTQLLIASTTFC
jgi:hypothetical protein